MAILDDLGLTIRLAYSVNRYLVDAYTGPVIRIIDSSTVPKEADFVPHVSNGLVRDGTVSETPDQWGTAPLKLHTLYDQSGVGYDMDDILGSIHVILDPDGSGKWCLAADPDGSAQNIARTSLTVPGNSWQNDSFVYSGVMSHDYYLQSSQYISKVFGPVANTLENLGLYRHPVTYGSPNFVSGTAQSNHTQNTSGSRQYARYEVFVNQLMKTTAGSSTSVTKLFTEDNEESASPAETWRVFNQKYEIFINYEKIGVHFFEVAVVSSATNISDADRSDLAQSQMAFYETTDYVPPPTGVTISPAPGVMTSSGAIFDIAMSRLVTPSSVMATVSGEDQVINKGLTFIPVGVDLSVTGDAQSVIRNSVRAPLMSEVAANGSSITINRMRVTDAATANLSVAGENDAMRSDRSMQPAPSTMTVSGQSFALQKVASVIIAAAGALMNVDGLAFTYTARRTVAAGIVTINMTGESMTLPTARDLTANHGQVRFAGRPMSGLNYLVVDKKKLTRQKNRSRTQIGVGMWIN